MHSAPRSRDGGAGALLWSGSRAAVTVAFVVAVAAFKEIRYLGVPFTSSGDPAYTELSILRVFHGGVFLGPYSRFGWHHPGPLHVPPIRTYLWAERG